MEGKISPLIMLLAMSEKCTSAIMDPTVQSLLTGSMEDMDTTALAGKTGEPLCLCIGSIPSDEFCNALEPGTSDCTFGEAAGSQSVRQVCSKQTHTPSLQRHNVACIHLRV